MNRETEGRTDLKKLIGNFCDNANVHRKVVVVSVGKID
jgi:hypothetical protein